MKLPRVSPLTIPSSHRIIRMTAMVSSMVRLLRCAPIGADPGPMSNRYATSPSVTLTRRLIVVVQTFAAILAMAELVSAQEPIRQPDTSSTTNEHRTASDVGTFLAGPPAGLGAHENRHLLLDSILQAPP